MTVELIQGDCLEVMRGMPDNSVDLVLTDPPYFKVKGEAWDNQWDTAEGFLAWLDTVLEQFYRLLKPNGSLYLFASPKMAARVEVLIGKRFNVLNNIRWQKEAGWHKKTDKEMIRSYLSPWEACVFAEHYGADNIAKGEAGYAAKCEELRGFLFEPLRAYLDGERMRAGITSRRVAEEFQKKTGSRTVTGMAGHWFTSVQWSLPTEKNYNWLRETFARLNHNGEYLRREYEDLRREYEDLRREYEDLRREYEDLRRPFSVSADVPFTDVWTFKTVNTYKDKHPCEKPADMLEHIISTSSKEGSVVLDAFMGTGSTGKACQNLDRNFIGIEIDPDYFKIAEQRIMNAQPPLFTETT